MKKFSFSLQSVHKLKESQRDQKQTELFKTQARLDELSERELELTNKLEACSLQYANDLSFGISAFQIAWYDNYAVYLNNRILKLSVLIREAERAVEEKKAELVEIMREIKTLEKLKAEQYLKYLEEAAKEEEKELGDLMSYKNCNESGLVLEMA